MKTRIVTICVCVFFFLIAKQAGESTSGRASAHAHSAMRLHRSGPGLERTETFDTLSKQDYDFDLVIQLVITSLIVI